MIKIIQPGTVKKSTCECCGCVFSYENEDVLIDGSFSMDFLRPRRAYVNCPQCNDIVILEKTFCRYV